MKTYVSKPVEIHAVQWTGDTAVLPQDPRIHYTDQEHVLISTLEGEMMASLTDWIILGTEGELYPCKDVVFQRKYVEQPDPIYHQGME